MPSADSPKRLPSIRKIAAAAGASPMTVSRALRGSSLVTEEKRKRIEQVARDMGYVRNPLAGALMSEMRRSRPRAFHGVLAVLDMDGPEHRPAGSVAYHAKLTAGAINRAKEIGFSADLITTGGDMSAERFGSILHARGIRGVFILPVRERPDLTRLDWRQLSGVYSDYLIERPHLHSVCSDHYRSILSALEHLRALGYRRPGLVMNAFHSARLLHRPLAAYGAYQATHEDTAHLASLLMWLPGEAEFTAWFRATKCDVVLTHLPEVLGWMKSAGARVPETHGFCLLNVENSETPCAGLDLQPRLIGERSMEMLIAMVLRGEHGIPAQPSTTLVPANWVDGPTVRNLRKPGEGIPESGVWKWAPPDRRKWGEVPGKEDAAFEAGSRAIFVPERSEKQKARTRAKT